MDRMNRNKFHIVADFLGDLARDEAHIRDFAACGLDTVIALQDPDRETLDLLQKYGLGAVVRGVVPFWLGGDGRNAGKFAETGTVESYRTAAATFADHPAIVGIEMGDEPSALDFPQYGKLIGEVKRLFPHQFGYVNLYPNYASVAQNDAAETVNQLGTPTYEEYVEAYTRLVGTDYICFDFYVYSSSVKKMYENFETVADACRRTGRRLWLILQVNSHREDAHMDLDKLRFQAYTALCYGAEYIEWGCYSPGWWYHNVLDGNGNKNAEYDLLKTFNAELRPIGDATVLYRNVATRYLGFTPDDEAVSCVKSQPVCAFSTGVFQDVRAARGPFVVGEMVHREDGRQALFVCAAGDPYGVAPATEELTFRALCPSVCLSDAAGRHTLTPDTQGVYHVKIKTNAGVLLAEET